jgi:hypothetical protein
VADGGGARPESMRERGLPVVASGGQVRGVVGKLGHSREGVGEEWGWEDESTCERGASGAAAVWQRGKRREKGGGPGCGGATRRGGAMGTGPDWRSSPGSGPRATLADDVRRARACRPDIAGRERADRWAAAQCRAAVPLTGGVGLSVGAVESTGARGPACEESGVAEPR